MKIALGSAQFGMQYGINNSSGRVGQEDLFKILRIASENNITTIDTAINYGESESSLGEIGVDSFNVVSKLPPLIDGELDIENWVFAEVQDSIARLRKSQLGGLLLHNPADLLSNKGDQLYEALRNIKLSGLVEKIGISIYSPSELDEIHKKYDLDIVQAPYNLIDRKIETSGWLQRLFEAGIEVHARSVFLQGLLLISTKDKIPCHFKPWKSLLETWWNWLEEGQFDPVKACLSFVLSKQEVNKVIVGVDSSSQLKGILSLLKDPDYSSWPDLSSEEEMLINPSNWKQ